MIKSEVKKLEEDYKDFMDIDSFPPYTFESKPVPLVKADNLVPNKPSGGI